MLNQRQKEIIEILSKEHNVRIEQLAKRFHVSGETIRRDLKYLENEKMLRRVHGGAVHSEMRIKELIYEEREIKNSEEKRAVAKLAANFIKDGDSLVINSGTSTQELAKALCQKNSLSVITNSIVIAGELVKNETNNVLVVGGKLRRDGMGISGNLSTEFVSKFRVDKAVIGIGGISLEHGLTEFQLEEAAVLRKMLEIAAQKIVLTDYSKLMQTCFNKVCDVKDIDIVLCDWNMPLKEQEEYREHGIEVYLAKR